MIPGRYAFRVEATIFTQGKPHVQSYNHDTLEEAWNGYRSALARPQVKTARIIVVLEEKTKEL